VIEREAKGGTLILGGGFAGAYVARLLGNHGATIVSPQNSMLYTPLLPEAASGTLEPRHVVVPLRQMCPRADVVITHAGNNTTTECFHFGKPMVALPLFWDQYDNAQRIDETGFGVRLPTYEFQEADLRGALDRLLDDTGLHARMATIAGRVQLSPGTEKAARLIEQLAATQAPVVA